MIRNIRRGSQAACGRYSLNWNPLPCFYEMLATACVYLPDDNERISDPVAVQRGAIEAVGKRPMQIFDGFCSCMIMIVI